MTLYLASTSPRRRLLLRRLGLRFHLLRPAVCETALLARLRRPPPARFALTAAKAKALSVTGQVKAGLVIGVDTVVAVGTTVLGKPQDESDARRMLQMLSGRTHTVVSGVAIVRMPDRRIFAGTESTRVAFRRLGRAEIERYVATREPYDKAGAYGIQEQAGIFVSRVDGSYLNVVGLPVGLLLNLLKQTGLHWPATG